MDPIHTSLPVIQNFFKPKKSKKQAVVDTNETAHLTNDIIINPIVAFLTDAHVKDLATLSVGNLCTGHRLFNVDEFYVKYPFTLHTSDVADATSKDTCQYIPLNGINVTSRYQEPAHVWIVSHKHP